MSSDFPQRTRSFGELLFRYMKINQLTVNALASQMDINLETLEVWLSDQIKKPNCHDVIKLVSIFKLNNEQRRELLSIVDCYRFGVLFDLYRKENGFNNSLLAQKLGVARITLKRWQDGLVKRPGCENIAELATLLKLSPEQEYEFFLLAGCTPPSISQQIKARKIENFNTLYTINNPSSVQNQSETRIEIKRPEAIPIPGIPITHPCQFFGQTAVLKKIRWAWQQPAALRHLAVIGERRSGKTSLLKYLQYVTQTPPNDLRPEQPQAWKTWLPNDLQFVFIDFQLAVMSKPDTLLKSILEQLHLPIPKECNLIDFSRLLAKQLNKPTVILMDEIGRGLQSPGLDSEFWSGLLALTKTNGQGGMNGKLGVVLTAPKSIQVLAQECDKDPSLFTIFGDSAHLTALTECEARDLINSFSQSLNEADIDWILEQSGCWPALLQLLCDARLFALEDEDASEDWKIDGLERIKPFLYLVNKPVD
jgi:transcriptional regulator with XRE-family HTH domain